MILRLSSSERFWTTASLTRTRRTPFKEFSSGGFRTALEPENRKSGMPWII